MAVPVSGRRGGSGQTMLVMDGREVEFWHPNNPILHRRRAGCDAPGPATLGGAASPQRSGDPGAGNAIKPAAALNPSSVKANPISQRRDGAGGGVGLQKRLRHEPLPCNGWSVHFYLIGTVQK